MRTKRFTRYTSEFKTKVLELANKEGKKKASIKFGVPAPTVAYWVKKHQPEPADHDLKNMIEAELARVSQRQAALQAVLKTFN